MPLLDHFRPPLSMQRHWYAFYNAWASNIAARLNRYLPEDYFAEPNVQFGIEIDVATFRERPGDSSSSPLSHAWSPPTPDYTLGMLLDEDVAEIAVYSSEAGPVLVAAIELVSPANKHRAETQAAFVTKCESYLHRGLGLVIIDIVSSRHENLHKKLMARLGDADGAPIASELYASAYRSISQDGHSRLEVWTYALSLNETLPEVPLWLRGGISLPLELEVTYQQTCIDHRIITPTA